MQLIYHLTFVIYKVKSHFYAQQIHFIIFSMNSEQLTIRFKFFSTKL